MSDILELSEQYRISGRLCRERLGQHRRRLRSGGLTMSEEIALRRDITLLNAMSRECIETAQYLQSYFERRQYFERLRSQSRK